MQRYQRFTRCTQSLPPTLHTNYFLYFSQRFCSTSHPSGTSVSADSHSAPTRKPRGILTPNTAVRSWTSKRQIAAPNGMSKPSIENFPDPLDFSKMEEEILKHWKETNAFEQSMKLSEGRKPYNFYDGPPFATGLPHYGHLLAGTIKDTVTRYAYQTGHHVVRRFGLDCHGLPIEFEIDKTLGIKSSHDVLKFGIANYNNECEKIVMRYSGEWEKTVTRSGRWIDFKNDYKTMGKDYMESVWWVFSQLWEKKLVYRGYKVMPFSTGCTTPLSNFEANLNYRDVSDVAVTVAFQSKDDANTYFLAWTTTPWTLPSNLSLCVHPELDYVKVHDVKTGKMYYLAEARLSEVYKKGKKDAEPAYTIVSKCKGIDLKGMRYEPIFPFFAELCGATAFRIITDNYVTSDSGTGIVHQAPGFGEEDNRACLANGIVEKGLKVCPVDENGCFTSEVPTYAGKYVKDADALIIKDLQDRGQLVAKGSIVHSYPFCWRSDTPLLYKAVDSWFVNVESFRDRLVRANNETYWVPDFVKTRRFSNWLEDAQDWNVSRNRYWGTPLPVWHSEDWEEIVCISSIAELEELSGVKNINNIHRQYVDEITIPSKRPGMPPLKRVSEVFDCWFESGSMPYAQQHYPFENKESFESSIFPADFVAEGLDQTRGWFYTLLVLGVALFDKAPFKNVVVNGLVLAEDGKKMSKSLKNYPDPSMIISQYGSDALRMYLINSPVVRAEPLRFREAGVRDIVRDILLPLFNAGKFFILNVNYCRSLGGDVSLSIQSDNEMDRWILASTQTMIKYVRKEMEMYRLFNVVPGVLRFVADLSNWYVRMNRDRMKSRESVEDGSQALSTFLSVIFDVARVLAPLAPFVAEMLYQQFRTLLPEEWQVDSVHFLMVPDVDSSKFDDALEAAMTRMMTVVDLIRVQRDRMEWTMKRPLKQVIIVHPDKTYRDDIEKMSKYIMREVNSFDVKTDSGEEYLVRKLDGNMVSLGRRLKNESVQIRKALQAMTAEEVNAFIKNKSGTVCGHELTMDDVKVLNNFKDNITGFETNTDNDVVVLVDKTEDEEQIDSWRAREFIHGVQQMRKKANLVIGEPIDVYYATDDAVLQASIEKRRDQISATVPGLWTTLDKKPESAEVKYEHEKEIGGSSIKIVYTLPSA